MLFYIPNTDIFKYLKNYFCLTQLGLRCIKKEIQNNSSHIVHTKRASTQWESCFFSAFSSELADVTVEKLTCQPLSHLLASNKLILWGVEILRSGNKETLALDLTKEPAFGQVFLCLLILIPNIVFMISNKENELKNKVWR